MSVLTPLITPEELQYLLGWPAPASQAPMQPDEPCPGMETMSLLQRSVSPSAGASMTASNA